MQLFGGKGKMLGLLLVLAAFGSFYLGDITAFTTSQKAIAGVALFIIYYCSAGRHFPSET